MKIIAFENDTKGMAIRFLSQEIRLMRPGCSILVTKASMIFIHDLSKVNFLFLTEANQSNIGNGKLYTLKETESMKDYHAEIMALIPEILS